MAGKNQHYVWRMLQRGFGEKRGKDYHIWIYRKNEIPRQTSTEKFGAEDFFYGIANSEADKKITDFENSIQGRIHEIRNLPNNAKVDPKFAAALLTHLETRSKFLRSDFSRLVSIVSKSVENSFKSPEAILRTLQQHVFEDPDLLDSIPGVRGMSADGKAKIGEMIVENARSSLKSGSDASIVAIQIKDLFERSRENSENIKKIHNDAIVALPSQSEREKAHVVCEFTVVRSTAASFILPDTCCAFLTEKAASPISDTGARYRTVIVPISSNSLIVGRRNHADHLDVRTINRVLAACSFDAFIADRNSSEFGALSHRIGKHAALLKEHQLQKILSAGQGK